MLHLLVQNKYFTIPFFVFLFCSFLAIYLYGSHDLHLTLNSWNHATADYIFAFLTKAAEGIALISVLLFTLFKKFRFTVILAVSWLFSVLTVQFMKQVVFVDAERPAKVFENQNLHFVDGVLLRYSHSFPSGHSADIFCVLFSLAIFMKNKSLGFFLFLAAISVAYSRVYLSQHFLLDVAVGSLIGVIYCLLVNLFFEKWSYFNKLKWPEKFLKFPIFS